MSVSICIPTYNRKKFEKLIEYNIDCQTYFNIQEIIILDDSDKDDPLCIRTLYPIRYIRVPRCSIGMKRNMLVSICKTKYVAFMDTDDFYHPDYISHSIFEMETNNKSIAGSADMIIYKDNQYYKQKCVFLYMLNEATLVFEKSAWQRFADSNTNEAVPFLLNNIPNIIETNIDRVMCCLAHDNNTINKTPWLKDQYKYHHLDEYKHHHKILSTINL